MHGCWSTMKWPGTVCSILLLTKILTVVSKVIVISDEDESGVEQYLGRNECTKGTEGSIKLVGEYVQYCHNGVWRWVCGDSWNADTARVACRQLGLPSTGVAYNSYYKPLPELGPFYLKTIWCDGTEPRLDTCTIDSGVSYGFWCSWRSGTGVTDYDYYVAALRCLPVNCPDLAAPVHGVVTVKSSIATYSCAAGYSLVGAATRTCDAQGWQGAAPICTKECIEGAIRLVEGSGTIQYCNNGVWRWVCGDTWNADTARVACRQLGLPTAGVAYNSYYKPLPGVGPFHLKSLSCDGSEVSLSRCIVSSGATYGYWCSWRPGTGSNGYDYLVAQLKCLHDRCPDLPAPTHGLVAVDGSTAAYSCGAGYGLVGAVTRTCKDGEWKEAAPICTKGCADGLIRLVEGSTATEETVQYCNNGVWGWVCGDSWNADTARVACRQLGLPTSSVFFNSYYKPLPDEDPFNLKSIFCDGTEGRLDRCTATVGGSTYGYWCSWRLGTGLNDHDYLVAELRCQ